MVKNNNAPVHKARDRNLAIAIWQQVSGNGKIFHTFELEHSFKGQDGNWQRKKISMLPDEALRAANLLNKSFMDYCTLPRFRKDDEPA